MASAACHRSKASSGRRPGGIVLAVVASAAVAVAAPSYAAIGETAQDAARSASASAPARATSDQESSQAAQPDPSPSFHWDAHPSIRFGTTHIDFRGRFQTDVRKSEAALQDGESRLDIARRRIGVEGEIAGVVAFQIERELINQDPWRDVYADYRPFDAVQVQAGKFKLPFSLDENTSATNLDFVYRSLAASTLAPGRDRGVLVHGRLWHRVMGYEAGVFEHDGRNARSRNPERVRGERTTAARLTTQPLRRMKSRLADLHLAVATTVSDVPEGFSGLRGRTVLDASFFSSDFWISGRRRRTGIEARWRPGPVSIKSEFIRVTEERRRQSVEDTDLSPLVATGWYVSATWALTGEAKSDGLDNPRRPFPQTGPGAIELAVRVEHLRFGSQAADDVPSTSPRANVVAGNTDRVITLGVNWYLNRWGKIQTNVIREQLANPSAGPLPGRTSFWSHVLRFQLTI